MMLPQTLAERAVLVAVVAALGLAGLMTAGGVVPATSADVDLRAWQSEPSDSLMEPWSGDWSGIKPTTVVLSAQNTTRPFGGGEVAAVEARAIQDGRRLYVNLEWTDKTEDTTVNGQTIFADAAAMELPGVPGVSVPSFCMGQVDSTVNIWQWKAAWQRDIDSGFATAQDRYPDGFVDTSPLKGDPAFMTARAVGNPLSQTDHASPVENLVAGGFGTLTTADMQDVDGHGVWKDGHWRVVFSRSLTESSGYPSLAVGDVTNIAFAVWDGSKGNRDGLKSVSQFMNLQISASPPPPGGGNSDLIVWGVLIALAGTAAVGLAWAYFAPRAGIR
jgi:hypothetical protein